MSDPVVAADGFTYDRTNIEDWFKTSNVSPRTGKQITTELITNNSMRISLDKYGHSTKSISHPDVDIIKPKRAKNPYACFCNEMRIRINDINSAKREGEKREKAIKFRELARMWINYTEEQKAPYVEMARLDKERYDREYCEYLGL